MNRKLIILFFVLVVLGFLNLRHLQNEANARRDRAAATRHGEHSGIWADRITMTNRPPTRLTEASKFWDDLTNWPDRLLIPEGVYSLHCEQLNKQGEMEFIYREHLKMITNFITAQFIISKESFDTHAKQNRNPRDYSQYGPAYAWRPDGTVHHKVFRKPSGNYESHSFDRFGILLSSLYAHDHSRSYRTVYYDAKGHPCITVSGSVDSKTGETNFSFRVKGKSVPKQEYEKAIKQFDESSKTRLSEDWL